MAIKEYTVTYYSIQCDGCKEQFADGVYDDVWQFEVEQHAADAEWLVFREASAEPSDSEAVLAVLCPECVDRCLTERNDR